MLKYIAGKYSKRKSIILINNSRRVKSLSFVVDNFDVNHESQLYSCRLSFKRYFGDDLMKEVLK